MRIVLAGVLGAIAMFAWTAVAHMAAPLAQIGISKMMEKETELKKTNPSGFVIYHPPGRSTDMHPMLFHEFIKEFAQSLIAAFLLSLTALAAYLARVGFVSLVGLFSVLGTDVSYCIWYGFPPEYTLTVMTIGLVGAIAAGLVIAAVVRPRPA